MIERVESDFTRIPNGILRSRELSGPAKEIICWMLSCSDEWNFTLSGMMKVLGRGAYYVRSAVHELEEKGYLERLPMREKGRFSDVRYIVHASPAKVTAQPEEEPVCEAPEEESPSAEKPQTVKEAAETPSILCSEPQVVTPQVEKPSAVKPQAACQTLSNTILTYTEKSKKNISKNNIRGECAPAPMGKFQNVYLTEDEKADLAKKIPRLGHYINKLSYYIETRGRDYKNHAAVIEQWAEGDGNLQAAPVAQKTLDGMTPVQRSQAFWG